MLLTEARLILIIGVILGVNVLVARQSLRKVAIIFLLACFSGAVAQLALGPGMNRYTSNISLYIGYVSAGVVLAWGIGLTSMWSLHIALCRVTGWRSHGILYVLSGIPAIIILEYIGSNILVMRLHDFHRYEPLMPITNSMRAPAWLFGYYALIGLLFYYLLKLLRLNTGDWSRFRLPRIPRRRYAAPVPEPSISPVFKVAEEAE